MGFWGQSWDYCVYCPGGQETKYRNKVSGEIITLFPCGSNNVNCARVNCDQFPEDMDNWEELKSQQ